MMVHQINWIYLLQTVLEGPPIPNDEEADVWGQGYMTPADDDGSPGRRYNF